MSDWKVVIQLYHELPQDEKDLFIDEILRTKRPVSNHEITNISSRDAYCHSQVGDNQIRCPHCEHDHIVKNGKNHGMQRYLCRNCKKTFNLATNTILADTKKDMETWRKIFDCMMQGLSVRKTAAICDISSKHAFRLRHKILDALQNMHRAVRLDGIVEADETYFRVSYKGNHKQDGFMMPRVAYMRGEPAFKRGISNEQVSVPCAVNLDGKSIARVANLGKSSSEDLINTFSGRIRKASFLCCDGAYGYNALARHEGIDVVHFPGEKRHNGIIGIQHVNNYHARLKEFLRPFHGVATKYMNNYLVWNNLTVYAKEPKSEIAKTFFEFTTTTYCTTKGRTLSKRPAIPVLTGYSKSLLHLGELQW